MAHADYQDVPEQSIDLKKGQTITVNFELVPAAHLGALALERFPPNVEVLVDGVSFGRLTKKATSVNR